MLCPVYSVKYFRDGYYKLIRFNTPRIPCLPTPREAFGDAEKKLSQAIARARSVITQVAICNDWDYFFTCTLDGAKHDRYDLDSFRKVFPQWLRDYNKKYRCKIRYLLVPERHKDGAWHIHGFLRGIPSDRLTPFVRGIHPRDLVDGGYLNWGDCSYKFGFCSLARIKDPVAAGHYVTKYITEDMAEACVGYGLHMYYCSIRLARAVPMGYSYERCVALDEFIQNDGKYCSTGYVKDVDWSFWLDYLPAEPLQLPCYAPESPVPLCMSNALLQLSMFDSAGWCSGEH